MIGSSSGATIKITAAGGIKHPRINNKISDEMRLNVKHYLDLWVAEINRFH
jgi:hypothetical protein